MAWTNVTFHNKNKSRAAQIIEAISNSSNGKSKAAVKETRTNLLFPQMLSEMSVKKKIWKEEDVFFKGALYTL